MGSRGRSIRLRIYFLVAVPLVTMAGLLAYVSWTTVDNAINLDRGPNLIHATAEPTALFIALLQDERRAAVVYLLQPNEANLAAFDAKTKATDGGVPAFRAAMASSGTVGTATQGETTQISQLTTGLLPRLSQLRDAVRARELGPGQPLTALHALQLYNAGSTQMLTLFVSEANSVTNNQQATQSLGLIQTVAARDMLSQEDALVAGMLAAGRIPPPDRAAFAQLAGARQNTMLNAAAMMGSANNQVYNRDLAQDGAQQAVVSKVEAAISAGAPIQALGLTPDAWQAATSKVLADELRGSIDTASATLAQGTAIAHSGWWRVGITCGIGLLGLVLTIVLTTVTGRGIIKRLRRLETSALTLAENQLPEVIGRLRRGEDVDVAAEAPALRVGNDEIGRVGQAFDLVRQTAIRAAVEEARLRRGLNDVFRSLARRSQSLLHRQLTLLDQMERRATDPEALDDLFRLDHLTTRMRRHAEGLVILAGGPAGRGWSSPVRMVDVMRGAIAEVEDYARVSVVSRSQAALSGSAVADVIHLLAELIENATTLSPPYTSVRVSGETVGNGFAIEVEDRGLGITQSRLSELNERLANPPEFNPSDSEQLGLFVVGQLAKRHGIRVTLRASPYGGTEAVVLIPRQLIVADEGFRAGLPGGTGPNAIIDGPLAENGARPVAGELLSGGDGSYSGTFGAGGALGDSPFPDSSPFGDTAFGSASGFGDGAHFTSGPRISGPMRRSRSEAADSQPHGTHHAPRRERAAGAANGFPGNGASGNGSSGNGRGDGADRTVDGIAGSAPFSESPFRSSGAGAAEDGLPGELPKRNRGRSGAAAASTPTSADTFDVFKPRTRGDDSHTPVQDPSASFGAGAPPYSGPFPGPQTVESVEPADGVGQSDGEHEGLPRRVKQASLAPQLRSDPAFRERQAAAAAGQGAGSPESGGPSPEEIRATMSALQRGWQEGRSHSATEGEPPWQTASEGE